MRAFFPLLVAAVLTVPAAAMAKEPALDHAWRVRNDGLDYSSSQKARPPRGRNEPAATMTVRAAKLGADHPSFEALVAKQLEHVRSSVELAEYAGGDGRRPIEGIATWTEELSGQKVAFAKFRMSSLGGEEFPEPRTGVHAFLLDGENLYFVNLVVVLPELGKEVEGDHHRLVEWLLAELGAGT